MIVNCYANFFFPKMNKPKNKERSENFYISIFHSVTPESWLPGLMPQLINESKLIYT